MCFADSSTGARGLEAISVAVCWPVTDVALRGTTEAVEAGLIVPILVGPRDEITELAASLKLDIGAYRIIDAPTEAQAEQHPLLSAVGRVPGADEGQPAYR